MSVEEPAYIGFAGQEQVATGDLVEVGLALQARAMKGGDERLVMIDESTGRTLSISLHGTPDQLRKRLEVFAAQLARRGDEAPPARRGPGRPRLGVVSREVSLLPRHWEWLARQPGGASAALRKLVEQARRENAAADRARMARDAAYHFMLELAGDRPGYEEALRALFAGDASALGKHIRSWPPDIRAQAQRMADRAFHLASEAAQAPGRDGDPTAGSR